MAAANTDACLRRLLAHEGGYTNHPSDAGGPTNFGITIADYRKYVKPGATAADVKAMRVDEAATIYKSQYWDALRCDQLAAGVDYSVFDYGVNSGVARCGKVLRRVLGLSDRDHRITADVLAELARRDPVAIIIAINDERLRFLRSLKTWPVFGAGWSRRVNDVRAQSLVLARTTRPASPPPPFSDSVASEGNSAATSKGQASVQSAARAAAAAGAATASGGVVAAGVLQGRTVTFAAVALVGLLATALVWIAIHWSRKLQQERVARGTGVVPDTSK